MRFTYTLKRVRAIFRAYVSAFDDSEDDGYPPTQHACCNIQFDNTIGPRAVEGSHNRGDDDHDNGPDVVGRLNNEDNDDVLDADAVAGVAMSVIASDDMG